MLFPLEAFGQAFGQAMAPKHPLEASADGEILNEREVDVLSRVPANLARTMIALVAPDSFLVHRAKIEEVFSNAPEEGH